MNGLTTDDAQKTALVTGITGQDGSYLAELLLAKGYEVHGIVRRSSSFNTQRIDQIYQDPHEAGARLFLHYGDLTDANALLGILRKIKPTEVYNLGAQSHVKVSFDMPVFTAETVALGGDDALVIGGVAEKRVLKIDHADFFNAVSFRQPQQVFRMIIAQHKSMGRGKAGENATP